MSLWEYFRDPRDFLILSSKLLQETVKVESYSIFQSACPHFIVNMLMLVPNVEYFDHL